jgi:DNA repair photolyase
MLNKQKGNMYGFVTHTWNVIKGKCPHDCEYCYMKVFPQGELRLDEKEFKTDLGRNNFIFVGSSCDMFAEAIPREWIIRVLDYCKKFPENTYLFQTKNPLRFTDLRGELISVNCILGTTIETNREGFSYNSPTIQERIRGMKIKGFRKMITIEPVIDFDVTILLDLIESVEPEFVNIGADSKNHNLPEPSAFKIENLIKGLKKFTKSISKENLSRILNTNGGKFFSSQP